MNEENTPQGNKNIPPINQTFNLQQGGQGMPMFTGANQTQGQVPGATQSMGDQTPPKILPNEPQSGIQVAPAVPQTPFISEVTEQTQKTPEIIQTSMTPKLQNTLVTLSEQIHDQKRIGLPDEKKSFFQNFKDAYKYIFGKKKETEEIHEHIKELNQGITSTNIPEVQESEELPSWLEKNIPSLGKLIKYLKKKTKKQDYLGIQVDQIKASLEPKIKRSFFKNWYTLLITNNDRLHFLDQLTTLMNSDIRLVDALRLIKQQSQKWAFKKLMLNMGAEVEAGQLLSNAMGNYPNVFPVMWIKLIKAGEASGKLARILEDLNKQQEDLQRLLGSIKGALLYPGFIIGMLVVLMVVMMTTIVPQIEGIYKQARVDLPGMTKFIIEISRFVIENGILTGFVIVAALVALVVSIKKVYYARKVWDLLNLHWPIFGVLNKDRNLVIFADNMQLLLSSGVLIGDALRITAEILPSLNFREETLRIREKINKGASMSQSMGLIDISREIIEKNSYFPMDFAQMINVGEQTGNLVAVLQKTSGTYSEKLKHMIKNLSTLLEPIMIVVVGVMVGVFLLAIMLPFFGLGKVARGL